MTHTALHDRLRDCPNLLLRALSEPVAKIFAPIFDRVPVAAGAILADHGEPIRKIYFPEDAVISLSVMVGDGSSYEVGLVGREGMVGASTLTGARRESFRASVLDDGYVRAIDVESFHRFSQTRPNLRELCLRYAHYFNEQLAYGAVAGLRDQVVSRLARRLLMLHDRVAGDELRLTHSELSTALNVRRATVTDCLHLLEGDHILACTRGNIVVRDRAKLEHAAGEIYGLPEATYRTLIGDFGKVFQPRDIGRGVDHAWKVRLNA